MISIKTRNKRASFNNHNLKLYEFDAKLIVFVTSVRFVILSGVNLYFAIKAPSAPHLLHITLKMLKLVVSLCLIAVALTTSKLSKSQ
jgi:hypothetical protein